MSDERRGPGRLEDGLFTLPASGNATAPEELRGLKDSCLHLAVWALTGLPPEELPPPEPYDEVARLERWRDWTCERGLRWQTTTAFRPHFLPGWIADIDVIGRPHAVVMRHDTMVWNCGVGPSELEPVRIRQAHWLRLADDDRELDGPKEPILVPRPAAPQPFLKPKVERQSDADTH